MIGGIVAKRVGIGEQVAADAIGIDELNDGSFFGNVGVSRSGAEATGRDLLIGLPAHGHVRDFEVAEKFFVERIFAEQELVELSEECAGLCALDDAVIVGAGDGENFTEAEESFGFVTGGGEFGRVIDGAGGDDGALSGHEARDGAEGADGAGISERDGGRFEIGDLQFICAGAGDDVVVSGDELRESHGISVFDVRDFERAGTVFGGDVDGEADVDLRMDDAKGFTAVFGEGVVEGGVGFDRLDDGPGDQVREAEFAAALGGATLIDDVAIFFDDTDGELALRGGNRDGEAGGHVLGDAGGDTAQGNELLVCAEGFRLFGDGGGGGVRR